jgi:hypothetical protein
MRFAVLFALPGVMLIVSGIIARRQRVIPATLPPAKIEDGRHFEPSTGERPPGTGVARIAFGIFLALGGGFLGLLSDAFSNSHWPPG